MTLLTALKN